MLMIIGDLRFLHPLLHFREVLIKLCFQGGEDGQRVPVGIEKHQGVHIEFPHLCLRPPAV